MGLENGRLSKENQLPLDVRDSKILAESGESDVWRADVVGSTGKDEKIALKENRREEFASDEEMLRSKKYYDYLKSFPEFGKFVPNTLYFKARMMEGESPKAYALQRLLSGKTVNRMPDAELYKDPEVVRQLSEFIDAAVAVVQATRIEKRIKPDFGKSADDDEQSTKLANVWLNPRYSNNILITDTADENGRRIFFVDTGENAGERAGGWWETYQRQVIGRVQEARLKEWKNELEKQAGNFS